MANDPVRADSAHHPAVIIEDERKASQAFLDNVVNDKNRHWLMAIREQIHQLAPCKVLVIGANDHATVYRAANIYLNKEGTTAVMDPDGLKGALPYEMNGDVLQIPKFCLDEQWDIIVVERKDELALKVAQKCYEAPCWVYVPKPTDAFGECHQLKECDGKINGIVVGQRTRTTK